MSLRGKPDMVTDPYDVIVIGGGPAGSTTAALVAEHGHRVLLLERAQFPRFQIGESLMPGTYWSFKRLGVLDKLRKSAFVKKYSVQFFGGSGRGSSALLFPSARPAREFGHVAGAEKRIRPDDAGERPRERGAGGAGNRRSGGPFRRRTGSRRQGKAYRRQPA